MKMGETAKDRRLLIREAGFKPTSLISVLCGAMVALGLVAFMSVIGVAAGNAVGIDTDTYSRHDWRVAGTTAAAIGVVVVFGAFLLGGYTAGRMSRRMGFRHGALVFLGAAALLAMATLVVAGSGAWTDFREHLANNDVPVGPGTWSDIGVIGGIAAAAAMLLGSVLGGIRGDQWHSRMTAAAERNRTRRTDTEPTTREPADDWSIDIRDRTEALEPSVEEERENEREARTEVGL
jgi:MFS family permease